MEALLHWGIILFASVMSGEEHGSSAMQHRLWSRRLRRILCPRKPGEASRKAGPELPRTVQGNTLALGNRTQAQLVAINSRPFYSSSKQHVLLMVFSGEDGVRANSSSHPFPCYQAAHCLAAALTFGEETPQEHPSFLLHPPSRPGLPYLHVM